MNGSCAVTFLADNPPYRRGEMASFPTGRAAALVGAGVARWADDAGTATEMAATPAEALVAADPHAGKRIGQATRYAKKG